MNISYRLMTVLLLTALLAGCAGRTPKPVAIVQPVDRQMDCNAIVSEVRSNSTQIGELGREDGQKVGQNVAVGIVGVLIPVLWFGMDFQNASGKEGTALESRNQYLSTLAQQKNCGT